MVAVDHVKPTSLFINWSQPCKPNGIITGYNIRVIANQSNTEPGCNPTESNKHINISSNTTLNYTITGLLPWTTYWLCVSANTSVGIGQEKCIQEQTSEGVPNKPAVVVDHVNSTSILINWTQPCRPNGIITGYNVRFIANQSNTGPGCNSTESNKHFNISSNTTLNYTITGLLPWTTYWLCVSANTSVGIGQEECIQKQTSEDVPGPVSNMSITNTTSHSIGVCWNSPCSPNGNITNYSVIRTLDSEFRNDTTVNLCYHFGDLLAYRNYSISVFAVTKNFVGKPFLMVVQTLIAVPFKPENVSCNATNSTAIEVIWNKGGYKTGPTNYFVTASDYVNRSNVFNCLTKGYDSTTCVITSLEEYWNYTINVTATTDKGSIVSESCSSRTHEAAPGYLQSFHVEQIQNLSAPRLVNISWTPPIEKEQNGIIRNYNISLKSDNGNDSWMLLASNQSTIVVPVQSNTNYTFAIHALTNAPGKENSTKLFIEPGVPTKPEENASNPSIQQAKTSLRTDPKRQIAVTLIPASFLCTNDNGVPDLWGVIVSSDEKSVVGLPYEGEKSGYTTKEQFTTTYVSAIKNEPIKPYRATNDSWTPGICSSKGQVFVVGTDATCIQNNYCNGQLSPGRLYRVKLFWCTKTACTETEYSLPISTEKENEPSLGPIIGGVAGSILAIVVIGVVSLYIWRRQMACFKNKMKKLDEGEDNSGFIVDELEDTRTSRPVKKSEFFTHFQNLSANANLLFSRDYQDLEKLSPRYATSDSELEETRTKNRYTNILPFNKTRVKLVAIEDEPGSDYINANYVPGPVSGREYIATQGPLASTINDFWRMIWEQNVSIIVMLTQCVERGRKKCDCYWPSDKNEALFYGDIVVKLESESHLPDFILRTFNLHLGDIKRNVRHYYYLLWPDMGTPACSDYMIRFVDTVRRDIRPDMTGPMVVHCSAGVGRTGTYITLDSIIRKINAGEQNIDIFGHILSLRHCRVNMVQTESQYVYIHECIRDYLQTGSEPEAEYINSPEHDQIYENVSSSQF